MQYVDAGPRAPVSFVSETLFVLILLKPRERTGPCDYTFGKQWVAPRILSVVSRIKRMVSLVLSALCPHGETSGGL
jgi:hypothetical protein